MIANDQELLRAGFRALLEAEEDIAVVGEASWSFSPMSLGW